MREFGKRWWAAFVPKAAPAVVVALGFAALGALLDTLRARKPGSGDQVEGPATRCDLCTGYQLGEGQQRIDRGGKLHHPRCAELSAVVEVS